MRKRMLAPLVFGLIHAMSSPMFEIFQPRTLWFQTAESRKYKQHLCSAFGSFGSVVLTPPKGSPSTLPLVHFVAESWATQRNQGDW